MPKPFLFPGVYVEEVTLGDRPISGVATSIAAFVGYTKRGRDHAAGRVQSATDYSRLFGGLAADSEVSYAVSQFFANGGREAWVVRVPRIGARAATVTLKDGTTRTAKQALKLRALSSGAAEFPLTAEVALDGIAPSDTETYRLTLTDHASGTTESFVVSQAAHAPHFVLTVLNDAARGSQLVRAEIPDTDARRPAPTGTTGGDIELAALPATLALEISSDQPGQPTPVSRVRVSLLAAGGPTPASTPELAQRIEARINAALAATHPGAAVRCSTTASGRGLCLRAAFDQARWPGTRDAILSVRGGAALRLSGSAASRNVATYVLGGGRAVAAQSESAAGSDGTSLPTAPELIGSRAAQPPTGLFALEAVDLFNLLLIPDATRPKPGAPLRSDLTDSVAIFQAALAYAKERRAFLLIDPPLEVDRVEAARQWVSTTLAPLHDANAAAYFPRVRLADPLHGFQLRSFAPSGVVAGLYSRTDTQRGVWKAPAGVDASLRGVAAPALPLNDLENAQLNPLGLNCLRSFPGRGVVAWGARTLAGADTVASEWKYIPVRRLALLMEESIGRGLRWAAFEANDETLWASLRRNVDSFLHTLFTQGAFAGSSPREAYVVTCDASTTTATDQASGLVNVFVGFAPLRPAEFLVLRIQQRTRPATVS